MRDAGFEEPCESYEEMAALRAHSDIAFSSHRIDLPKAVAVGAPCAVVTQQPGTRIPGDRRRANQKINESEGVAVDGPLVTALNAFGADL